MTFTRADTANRRARNSISPEPVIVIGGGIVGASIAWHLAKETDVIIVAERVGGVVTPQSFSWLNMAGTTEKFYYDFRRRSLRRWAEMGKELPNLPISWRGTLVCDRTPDERAKYQKRQQEWGTDVRRVGQEGLVALEPEIEESEFSSVGWGVFVREEGTVEAHTAAAQLVVEAQLRGATLLETSVTGFLKDERGRVSGVMTDRGEVRGRHVILAAGLASVPLLATENINLHLNSTKGLLANTAPTDKQHLNALVRLPGLHMRQTLDGRIRFGASFSGGPPGDEPQVTARKLFEQVQKALKKGNELEFDSYTVGVRPEPEDGYPILGATGLDGLDVAVMHSGVTNAALVGQLLTKKVLHGVEDPMLEEYRLSRFE